MRLTNFVAVLTLSTFVVGCVMEEDGREWEPDDEVGSTQQGLSFPGGAMTVNAMTVNAMTVNSLYSYGLVDSSMTSYGLASLTSTSTPNYMNFRYAMLDTEARTFMRYLVHCALNAGDAIYLQDSNGTYHGFSGGLGLAPGWKNSGIGTYPRQWVAACLGAHTNKEGKQVRISVRQDPGDSGPYSYESSLTEYERRVYDNVDGAFYGDLFAAHYHMYAAGMYYKGGDALSERFCDHNDPSCPIFVPGTIDETGRNDPEMCSRLGSAAAEQAGSCLGFYDGDYRADSCYSRNFCSSTGYGTRFYKVLTVYRAGYHCSHDTFQTGSKLPEDCSPGAWTAIRVRGDSYCKNTAWDAACVEKVVRYSADHDLCTTGSPLVVGDNSCIDRICEADPYCCKANGQWDNACKSQVGSICGINCSTHRPY